MVVIMINFARSGGTLLNKCLGSLPNTIILSEVNPIGPNQDDDDSLPPRSVKGQAKNWYQLELKSSGFTDNICEIAEIASQTGKNFIVRDWSVVNFRPNRYNQFNPPQRFLTLDSLKNQVDIVPFAFVRDSIDVWLSMGCPPKDDFFKIYLNYTEAIIAEGIGVFKYENFCQQPDEEMLKICEYCGLQYSDSYKNYSSFNKVTGDVQIPGGSRGIRQMKIRRLPRKRISNNEQMQLNECQDMQKANRLLGYPTTYEACEIESRWSNISDKPQRILRAFLNNPLYFLRVQRKSKQLSKE